MFKLTKNGNLTVRKVRTYQRGSLKPWIGGRLCNDENKNVQKDKQWFTNKTTHRSSNTNHTKHNIELRLKSSNTKYMQQYKGIIQNINNIVMEYIFRYLSVRNIHQRYIWYVIKVGRSVCCLHCKIIINYVLIMLNHSVINVTEWL
jgi:hypothetical protein